MLVDTIAHLLAVALGLTADERAGCAGVRLAHPVAPIILLLLCQIAPAIVHLVAQDCVQLQHSLDVDVSLEKRP